MPSGGFERRRARGSRLGLLLGRKHPSQVMDDVALREFAPRQGLGSGVGEWVPMLVVARLAVPRWIDNSGRPAESHLLRLSRVDPT